MANNTFFSLFFKRNKYVTASMKSNARKGSTSTALAKFMAGGGQLSMTYQD
jgi:hypothetical protein